jgi:type IV secretory pathway VirD2 relaxase
VAALKTVFLSARAGLNQLIIGLLRLVQLNAKIAQFAPSKAIRAMGRQAEEFADAMADSLAVSVEADSQAALKSGDVAFGDTLTKAIAKQRAELAKRRATRSNLGAGLDVGTDAVVGPKPDAVRESESTDRIVDAIADIPDAAIQLQQAQATSGTVGSFAGAAIERIASVQAQERELSNREKELAIQRQLAAQGKDANGMFEDMLQLQRDRLGGAFQ